MLFKLALKNIKKSFKDYAIYFLTLILGVAIFYMFNSLDSQTVMQNVSLSTKQIIELMINTLGIVSIFVAIVLGFLIVYANNFLIKRRKKEFGIYMTLGMGKRQISKILFLETIFIGVVSLVVGLVIGIFGSQLMSILVAKVFEADMSKFEFVFSSAALIKTCIYFGIMYVAVMIFNTFSISKCKLINLINARKRNETVKIKNPIISILIFIIAVVALGYAYYKVTVEPNTIITSADALVPILIGSISTFLIFWSVSGLLLKVVQLNKKVYLKGTNMFILRQVNSKINTTVMSMTIICLMLFVTICVLSSAVTVTKMVTTELEELTPVDASFFKYYDLTAEDGVSEKTIADSKITIQEALEKVNFDMGNFKETLSVDMYKESQITPRITLGNQIDELKSKFPMMYVDGQEDIMKVSDYNKVAKMYGIPEYSLNDNEYIILCDYDNIKVYRDMALKENLTLKIGGKEYAPKYQECQEGFIQMTPSKMNMGIILVPDATEGLTRSANYFIVNYNATTDKEKHQVEALLSDPNSEYVKALKELEASLSGGSRISIYEASVGLSAMVSFIAIYLGVIFLIASSAILALKELSESSDNKERYAVLRKLGVDEKMLNKSLFIQIGIFFIIPLLVAIIHSIFGIQFCLYVLETIGQMKDMLWPVVYAALFIVLIYGGYFVATYLGSKRIIRE